MKEHIIKFKGFYIFCIGLIFNFCESIYFGQNAERCFNIMPCSIGEYVCDIISLVIVFLGFSIVMLDSKQVVNHYSINVDYQTGKYTQDVIDCLEGKLKENIKKESKVNK